MWRHFVFAFIRKLGYIAAALLVAAITSFVAMRQANAQTPPVLTCASYTNATATSDCNAANGSGFTSLGAVSAWWDAYIATCEAETPHSGWSWQTQGGVVRYLRRWTSVDCNPPEGWTAMAGIYVGATAPTGCESDAAWLEGGLCGPPAPECDFEAAQAAGPFNKSYSTGIGSIPASYCSSGSQCLYARVDRFCVGNQCLATFEPTDDECTTEDEETPDPYSKCVQDGGLKICDSPSDANESETNDCAYLNDSYVCTDNIPPNGCTYLAGGSMLCTTTADAPPAPDDGSTPGTPAPADGDVDTGSNTYNYYNSSTVNGSSGGTEGTDSTGGPATDGEGEGEGECEGSSCTGELPGDNEEVDTFGNLFAQFWARVNASDLISSFSGIAGSMPSGSCSGVSSDPIAFLGGSSLELDVHCTLWPDLVTIIYPVMLALWALMGGLIILRA